MRYDFAIFSALWSTRWRASWNHNASFLGSKQHRATKWLCIIGTQVGINDAAQSFLPFSWGAISRACYTQITNINKVRPRLEKSAFSSTRCQWKNDVNSSAVRHPPISSQSQACTRCWQSASVHSMPEVIIWPMVSLHTKNENNIWYSIPTMEQSTF